MSLCRDLNGALGSFILGFIGVADGTLLVNIAKEVRVIALGIADTAGALEVRSQMGQAFTTGLVLGWQVRQVPPAKSGQRQ